MKCGQILASSCRCASSLRWSSLSLYLHQSSSLNSTAASKSILSHGCKSPTFICSQSLTSSQKSLYLSHRRLKNLNLSIKSSLGGTSNLDSTSVLLDCNKPQANRIPTAESVAFKVCENGGRIVRSHCFCDACHISFYKKCHCINCVVFVWRTNF